jgi:hypothetical protein
LRLGRLRRGELIAGASGVALAILLFTGQWYAIPDVLAHTAKVLGAGTGYNGWHVVGLWRWLLVPTVLAAVALAWFQATQRAPAIPVTFGVFVTVLGGLSTLALVYRVLLVSPPPNLNREAVAYLGLLAAIGITYGGFASMREEGGTDPRTLDIETVRLPDGT